MRQTDDILASESLWETWYDQATGTKYYRPRLSLVVSDMEWASNLSRLPTKHLNARLLSAYVENLSAIIGVPTYMDMAKLKPFARGWRDG